MQDLGGLFRMSGFQHYQLSGRYSLFGGLRYIYRVADNDFGAFKAPLFLGAPSSKGVWDKGGTSASNPPIPQVPSIWGWRVSSVPSSSAMAWRRGHDMFYLQLGTTFQ